MCLLFVFLGGCTAGRPASSSLPQTSSSLAQKVASQAEPNSVPLSEIQYPDQDTIQDTIQDTNDQERLALLWQRRKQADSLSDYPLGPGDVLVISVPELKEIAQEQVRISGEGTIELPLLGTIQAAGLTEKKLKKEIRLLLQVDYMHDPQVSLFVAQHHNRQVAVVGAVNQPGLYGLQSESDTILDLVARAGGMSSKAAARLLFVPSEPARGAEAKQLQASLPMQLTSLDATSSILKKTEPIIIDLRTLTKGGTQLYLNTPVRPGDVILVPGNGVFLVDGWVERPGSYQVFLGLTLVGAIASAGGTLFAADEGAVRIVRLSKTGQKTIIPADLDRIKKGEQTDIPIQEGDIIEVSYSNAKIVPYGLYTAITSVFNTGVSYRLDN